MLILAAADVHGVLGVYRWLVEKASGANVLILAGDLLAADFADKQARQAQEIIAVLKQVPVPVFYVMGNDDNVDLAYEDEHIRPLHGRRIEFAGYNFVGYQYTNPFVGDVFVKEDNEIDADLQAMTAMVDDHTVFVTHAPAYGALDQVYDENVGSRAIARLAQRPVLAHIHGHIHHRFGRDGMHFNVASAGLSRAMLIDLPSLRHESLGVDWGPAF